MIWKECNCFCLNTRVLLSQYKFFIGIVLFFSFKFSVKQQSLPHYLTGTLSHTVASCCRVDVVLFSAVIFILWWQLQRVWLLFTVTHLSARPPESGTSAFYAKLSGDVRLICYGRGANQARPSTFAFVKYILPVLLL